MRAISNTRARKLLPVSLCAFRLCDADDRPFSIWLYAGRLLNDLWFFRKPHKFVRGLDFSCCDKAQLCGRFDTGAVKRRCCPDSPQWPKLLGIAAASSLATFTFLSQLSSCDARHQRKFLVS
jgi:hypothetical protein